MTKLLFIGDVHGKWAAYNNIIQNTNLNSIQVGDYGVGFPGSNADELHKILDVSGKHKFIRGNHDSPGECKYMPNYISDVTYLSEFEMMLVGGALSIDKEWRTEGISYWQDEELSYNDLNLAINTYEMVKPRIMITHDAPESIIPTLFPFYRKDYPSATRVAFQAMLEIHTPDIWIFGHWHNSQNTIINNTRFICLNELETIELEV